MTGKRNITVVTGSRAEYGLLKPVIQAIDDRPELRLQLIVTGTHLLKEFGQSVRDIVADDWPIDARIRLQNAQDNPIEQTAGMGRAITQITRTFARLGSDIVLVLGDRIEAFAAASAAVTGGLLLAHIHGGDIAPGVNDEAYRHAISKLAHLHFVATPGAKQRLLRMGEQPFRVKLTGSPALDDIKSTLCRDIDELSRNVGFDVRQDFLIVQQHPAGFSATQEEKFMRQTLQAAHVTDLHLIVMHPNSDPGFSGILKAAQVFCRRTDHPLIKHLPRPIFLGLLKKCRALIGNSSAGLIEAGYLGTPVLNIGSRQSGREHGDNVVHLPYGTGPIGKTLTRLLKKPGHRQIQRLYGTGSAGRKIAGHLASHALIARLRPKTSHFPTRC